MLQHCCLTSNFFATFTNEGFFYEHGPFEIADDGAILTLRKYRWSRIANVLYIEQPAGVGFSYSDSAKYFHNDDTSSM